MQIDSSEEKKNQTIFASGFLNIHRYLMLQSLQEPAFLCSFVHFSTEYRKGYLVFQTYLRSYKTLFFFPSESYPLKRLMKRHSLISFLFL